MITSIKIDSEGPDGDWLTIEDDEFVCNPLSCGIGDSFRLRLTNEACAQLDKALQPWREHMAEGEAVRAELMAHKGAGKCSVWIPGVGPCMAQADHEGDHTPLLGHLMKGT